MRYIMQMKSDTKTFTAAIVNMAVKGALAIDNQDGTFTLSKKTEITPLAKEEKSAYQELFKNASSIVLNQRTNNIIAQTNKYFYLSLKKQFNKLYFATNFVYMIPAILLALFALTFSISSFSSKIISPFMTMFFLAVFTIIPISLLIKNIPLVKTALRYRDFSTFKSILPTFFAAFIFIGFAVPHFMASALSASVFTTLLLFVLISLLLLFQFLLKAPTKEGRKIMDQIEGFKLFLSRKQNNRRLNKTIISTEALEKYLPYAIALNVENEWGEAFNSVVENAEGKISYHPLWYTGGTWGAAFPGFLTHSLSSSFSSSTSSSISGGSSGGGGGGGGGR